LAVVLAEFRDPVSYDGVAYRAHACGAQRASAWEGWIEFVPVSGDSEVLISTVESRQPEREHLVYWAQGLSHVYLEGALNRARKPLTVRVPIIEEPISDHPAVRRVSVQRVIRNIFTRSR